MKIQGRGKMSEIVRSFDWKATQLGAMEEWSDPLVVAVNIILTAGIPMQLFWGQEFICIYNDAMSEALSDKHPGALGQAARVVWSEAWSVIGPQLGQVYAEGRAVSFEDVFLPLYKEGVLMDQFWDYSYSPIFDRDGNVVGILDVAQDVTERVLARQHLARSEERFRTLIDQASVGINIGDATGRLSYMNRTLLRLLGYSEEEVRLGTVRWDELTPPKYAAADQRALEQLQATGVASPYEKSYRAKDGHFVPLQLGAVLIPSLGDELSKDIAVFFTDLTQQKKAEAAVLQAEKLSVVGRLAATISHEINNPLEAITNLLFIIRALPDLPTTAVDYLELAEREVARVSQVATQTLRFHRQSTAATSVGPESLVEEVLQLYAGRLRNYSISVHREYAPNVIFTCFEGDIRQVLNNLIGNASDAMRNGGKLTIRTREATRWSTGQRGIRMTIADTGTGISASIREHVFDAFYSTKGINGSGLGLWISCRIVHKHRGFIRFRNVLNGRTGSVFQLWLPLALASSANEPWHQSDPDHEQGVGQTHSLPIRMDISSLAAS